MGLSQRLEIRQSHALVMTPQLMQAIKLLELSNMDLTAYVEGELERNPLLEQAGEPEANEAIASAPTPEPAWAEGREGSVGAPERAAGDIDDVPPADTNAAASRANNEEAPRYSEWAGHTYRNEDYNPEAFVAAETTLADHLAAQLS